MNADDGEHPWRDPELLNELYHEQGLTLVEVGERLGCSKKTVINWMEEFGLERRTRSEAILGEPWHEKDRLERLYHDEELTQREIAEKFDCSVTTIQKWMHRLDVETEGPTDTTVPIDVNYPGLEGRFWEKVDRGEPDECWDWKAGKVNGYGMIRVGDRQAKASRVSYALAHEDPHGQLVLHTCDNPGCVNPNHLYLGTQLENAQDKVERGRQNISRGEEASTPKLSAEDVIEMRARLDKGETQAALADEYDISPAQMSRIARGVNWEWIDGDMGKR